MWGKGPSSFFAHQHSIFPASFIERNSSSSLSLHLKKKPIDHMCMYLFLDSVLFHWFRCICDCCSFIVSLEIRWYVSSNFVIFFSPNYFRYSFTFPCTFQNQLMGLCKNNKILMGFWLKVRWIHMADMKLCLIDLLLHGG